MKKKGFTLIELLAVIVILAIIMVIVVPKIMNVIDESRMKAFEESAGLLAKTAQLNQAIDKVNGQTPIEEYTFSSGYQTSSVPLKFKGDVPNSGIIKVINGKVSLALISKDLRYCATKAYSGDVQVRKLEDVCSVGDLSVEATSTETHLAYTPGQIIKYNPVSNETCTTITGTCYSWRVITVGDTINKSKITLQRTSNIGNSTYWGTSTTANGPTHILSVIENETSTWNDALKLNYTYDTSLAANNYGTLSCVNGECTVNGNKITTNIKARAITGEEVTALVKYYGTPEGSNADKWTLAAGAEDWYYFNNNGYIMGTRTSGASSTDLSWLCDNAGWGYWSLSPYNSDAIKAYRLDCGGGGYFAYFDITASSYFSVRPVITIPKSYIES